ncbi:MAG: hypothetical protein AAF565_04820 [Pseudomonadota bacterium]
MNETRISGATSLEGMKAALDAANGPKRASFHEDGAIVLYSGPRNDSTVDTKLFQNIQQHDKGASGDALGQHLAKQALFNWVEDRYQSTALATELLFSSTHGPALFEMDTLPDDIGDRLDALLGGAEAQKLASVPEAASGSEGNNVLPQINGGQGPQIAAIQPQVTDDDVEEVDDIQEPEDGDLELEDNDHEYDDDEEILGAHETLNEFERRVTEFDEDVEDDLLMALDDEIEADMFSTDIQDEADIDLEALEMELREIDAMDDPPSSVPSGASSDVDAAHQANADFSQSSNALPPAPSALRHGAGQPARGRLSSRQMDQKHIADGVKLAYGQMKTYGRRVRQRREAHAKMMATKHNKVLAQKASQEKMTRRDYQNRVHIPYCVNKIMDGGSRHRIPAYVDVLKKAREINKEKGFDDKFGGEHLNGRERNAAKELFLKTMRESGEDTAPMDAASITRLLAPALADHLAVMD